MPIFEYNCPECGIIEILLMPGEKELTNCPNCEAKGKKSRISKAISASALKFQGSGFYITDYTGKGGSKSESGQASEKAAKPEKPESKK